jgi:hypothetical protein
MQFRVLIKLLMFAGTTELQRPPPSRRERDGFLVLRNSVVAIKLIARPEMYDSIVSVANVSGIHYFDSDPEKISNLFQPPLAQ